MNGGAQSQLLGRYARALFKALLCRSFPRGFDGRVADSGDLMFRSSAKNVAGMKGIWKRARESTA